MMKKIFLIIIIQVIFYSFIFSQTTDHKKLRDDFYSILIKKIGLSAKDCNYIKNIGYSPVFSYILLYIAKETKIPIEELVKMREENGYSWQDMCDTVGADYEKIINKAREDEIKYNLRFPVETEGEMKKSIVTVPKKERGDKK